MFRIYSSLTEYGTERSCVQFRVIGNYNLRKGIVPAKDYVTAVLSLDVKPRLLERANAFFARNARQ